MARTIAKCFFTNLLLLLAVATGPAQSNLDSNTFTRLFDSWNTRADNWEVYPKNHDRMSACSFAAASLTSEKEIENRANQSAIADGKWSLNLRSAHAFETGDVCLLLGRDFNRNDLRFPRNAGVHKATIDRIRWYYLPWVKSESLLTFLGPNANFNLNPMDNEVAHHSFRLASWPKSSVGTPRSFRTLAKRPIFFSRTFSNANPLRPAKTHLKPKTKRLPPTNQTASIERMDRYWSYYADCDRWNIQFAKNITRTVVSEKTAYLSWVGTTPIFVGPLTNGIKSQPRKPRGRISRIVTSLLAGISGPLQELEFRLYESSLASIQADTVDRKRLISVE